MRILAVTNIYPTPADPTMGTYVEHQIKSLRDIGLSVDLWYLDRAVQGRSVYLRMSKSLREEVKDGRYDLMHVMYSGVMADLATRAVRSIPRVITIHGTDLHGSELSPTVQRLSAYIGVLASRRAARRAEGVIVVSPSLREALPEYVDRSKVRVIPCGIDLERFKPLDPAKCRQELGWGGNALHILFATAHDDPIKRPGLAFRAVDALRNLGIEAEMQIMRGIPYDRVPVWINASDALILTSQREGSPTIVKECLACNVPVVSVDTGDVKALVEGIEGCQITAADPAELAAGLRAACSMRNQINARSRMGRFSLERTAQEIQEFYCEVLGPRWDSTHRQENSLALEI
jgi:teichuronic acid biosynthesis glycosyltransferase TuaC